MIRITLSLFFCFTFFYSTSAQQALENVERIVMPGVDNEVLQAKEQERRKRKEVPEFATPLYVQITPFTHGTWEELPNEKALWRLRIFSQNAHSLNLGFDRYNLPKSAELSIYNPDKSIVEGAFTAADNEVHGEFWSPIIAGNEVVLEVQIDIDEKSQLDLQLTRVNHGFGGQFALQNCHLDVVCGIADGFDEVEQYRDIIQSVAMYTIAGTRICTGFLVNNTRRDCTPYFMTAQHCGVSAGGAASMVVYWNFENSTCRDINAFENGLRGDGPLEDFNSGASLLAEYAPSDMQLMLLDDPVSDKANAYFAGWDRSTNLPESTICIHHPDTEEKRISFDNDPPFVGTWEDDDVPVPGGNHLVIADWDLGSTEGGSSGAPLFNENGFVVGQLHGGLASCSNDAYDSYGWFNTSWKGGGTDGSSIKNWLDPDNIGIEVLEGKWNTGCGQSIIAETAVVNACSDGEAIIKLRLGDIESEDLALSLEGLPTEVSAIFSQSTVSAGDSLELSISNLNQSAGQAFVLDIIGENETDRFTTFIRLNVFPNEVSAPNLAAPMNADPSATDRPLFTWEMQQEGTEYDFQLATDVDFINLVATRMASTETNFLPQTLMANTEYFWRVRSRTPCSESDWSETFSFKTVACAIASAQNLPVAIAPSNPNDYFSTIEVMEDGSIVDVNVTGIVGRHSWVSDLQIWLISPAGTEVLLMDRTCFDEDDFELSFNDDSPSASLPCPPTDGGTYQPAEPLSSFIGENVRGTWRLRIRDNEFQDGGTLNEWNLQFCLAGNDVAVNLSQSEFSICDEDKIEVTLFNGEGFGEMREISALGLPEDIEVNYTPNVADNLTDIQISNLSSLTAGNYEVLLTLDDGNTQNFTTLFLNKIGLPSIPVLTVPANNSTVQDTTVVAQWQASENSTSTLEFTTDSTFTNDIVNISLTENQLPLSVENGQTYYWRISSINECGESLSETSSFTVLLPVSVTEWTGGKVEIFPNPNSGQFYIDLAAIQGRVEVEVRSLDAKLIRQGSLNPNQTHLLDLEGVAKGIYFVRLISEDNGVLTKRVVVY